MSKKIISVLLSIMCLIGLVSCGGEEKKEENTLPPVSTTGLPENEKLTSSYETDGFVVNIYESYSEIAGYKGDGTTLTVPDAFMGIPVKSIGEYAFFENETLTQVTLPESLLIIGDSAFQSCTALTKVVLGSRVEMISQAAFRDSALEEINLPDSIAEIERYAFYRTRLIEVKLPANLSSVSKYAFYGCEMLTRVEFCQRIERVAEYAFSGCTSLQRVVITDRVKMISDYSFSDCTSLTAVFAPKSTALGENCFLGCAKLTIYSPSDSKASEAAKKYGYSFQTCPSADKMP
ncbi:MAG: leucine-rich repeat domain-containing protein [Clostridia bacterium]|nr:leucine-rich repeat domain-containing protein [Clostridia bacterium]